jgi:hypothetical protein
MSKENGTAASKAYPPEKEAVDVYDGRTYPGRSMPAKMSVGEVSYDAAALKEGKSNSMGHSANCSTKGEPSSGQPGRDDE